MVSNENRQMAQLEPLFDISHYIQGFEMVTASIGFDHNVYVLLIDKTPERIDGMFVQSKTKKAHTYKVLTVRK